MNVNPSRAVQNIANSRKNKLASWAVALVETITHPLTRSLTHSLTFYPEKGSDTFENRAKNKNVPLEYFGSNDINSLAKYVIRATGKHTQTQMYCGQLKKREI